MKNIKKSLALAGLLSVTAFQALAQTPAPTPVPVPVPAAAPAAAPAPAAPENTLVPKISLYSEYEYRGISQTSEKPALQFNLDYTHTSGFYAGLFVSNIKWIKDTRDELAAQNTTSRFLGGKGSVELDLFGGYKVEVAKDLTIDVGYLRYEYPNSEAITQRASSIVDTVALKKPNTDELYAGIGYGPVSAKYSYTVSDAFGLPNSKGSSFAELNFSKEVATGWTINGQVARQNYKNFSAANYTVYKIGASYDIGSGWTAGGYYKDTTAKPELYTYKGRDWSKGRLVVFVSKSF